MKVAIRHSLFAQVKADRRLVTMGKNLFARRADRYGIGTSARADRPHGQPAVVLTDEFLAELAVPRSTGRMRPRTAPRNLAAGKKAKYPTGGLSKNGGLQNDATFTE